MEDKSGYLVALVMALLGGVFLIMPLQAYFSTAGSENWPTVHGIITRSEVVTSMVSSGARGSSINYTLYIEYQYSVNSNKYTSTRISMTTYNIQEVQKKYPLNSEAVIYYNPHDHKTALLIPGDKPLDQDQWFVWGIVCVVFGIAVLIANIYFAIKKKQDFPFE